MRSVGKGMRVVRRLAGVLGAVGALVATAGPVPAGGGAAPAFVCPYPPAGCGSGNHNQVLL